MSEFMKPKFICSLIFVKDVNRSKDFYQNVLRQKIEWDFGRNVSFECGLSLWDGAYAHEITGLTQLSTDAWGKQNLELYFETEDLDREYEFLTKNDVLFVHPIIDQPWGQRCFRIYDRDHHIIEFGEPMPLVIRRYHDEGMSIEDIKKKTFMPIEAILSILE